MPEGWYTHVSLVDPVQDAEDKHDQAGHMFALDMCDDPECKDRVIKLGLISYRDVPVNLSRRHSDLAVLKKYSKASA